jgi:hypothetical protein
MRFIFLHCSEWSYCPEWNKWNIGSGENPADFKKSHVKIFPESVQEAMTILTIVLICLLLSY